MILIIKLSSATNDNVRFVSANHLERENIHKNIYLVGYQLYGTANFSDYQYWIEIGNANTIVNDSDLINKIPIFADKTVATINEFLPRPIYIGNYDLSQAMSINVLDTSFSAPSDTFDLTLIFEYTI